MTERIRVLVLILIMAAGSLLVAGTAIWILYRAAFEEELAHLVESAQSQARFIEAVARYDRIYSNDYKDGWQAATLTQIQESHREYQGFGRTGEFTLARREGDVIVFLLRHRHHTVECPEPIRFDSGLAEPMRQALLGKSGTVVGLDYRGETVLAAYEPVAVLDVGIVAKIDLAEVQEPFKRAGLLTAVFALFVVFIGAVLFVRVSSPLVLGLEQQARDLEVTVAALQESEERFRKTFELAAVGIAHVALDERFVRANPRLLEILGYTSDELLELSFRDVVGSEDVDDTEENLRRLFDGEIEMFSTETRHVRRDSSVVWGSLTVSLVRDESRHPRYFIVVLEDTTSRKQGEIAVKRSLAEKEVLLREIHHRIKNNMQVICSLLNLQTRGIEDMRLSRVIQESQNRVRAMALIHEILYESGDLSGIDLGRYVTKLSRSLIQMYGSEPGRIDLTIGARDIRLGIDDTVPCGLVISELLSNSLKYAFRDGRKGTIRIEAEASGDNEVVLVVRDDGIGIPDDVDIRKTDTMGMQLVMGLVENQLGGRITLDRAGGTCFTITFRPAAAGASV